MIIDNTFVIKTYLGSEPLPLVNPTQSLANSSAYSTFINNISAIYSSQSTTGSIPLFYKVGSNTDARSTLLFLQPKESYYFISKSNATVPYNIPYVGSLLSFSDTQTCTAIDIVPDRVTLTNTSGNYYYYNQNITNLALGESYQYSFKVLESNWPVTIIPDSGVLKSSQATNNFGAMIRFDSDVGVTDYSQFLPLSSQVNQLDKNNLFAMIEVSVEPPSNLDCPKVLDMLTIQCKNCIPIPTPTPTTTPTPTPTPAPPFSTTLTYISGTVSQDGINFGAASNGDTFEFTPLENATGLPATTVIKIAGNIVAVISIVSQYIGRPFRFTKASTGLSYLGNFVDGELNF